MGVKTITLTEKKGGLAGALIVREHHELVFISQSGMVQRTGVRGISKVGRPGQGVRVMNLRDDDVVSAVALVMETNTSAQVQADIAVGEDDTLVSATGAANGDAPDDAVTEAPDASPDDGADGAGPDADDDS
jgi:DNA gyrase subunit A